MDDSENEEGNEGIEISRRIRDLAPVIPLGVESEPCPRCPAAVVAVFLTPEETGEDPEEAPVRELIHCWSKFTSDRDPGKPDKDKIKKILDYDRYFTLVKDIGDWAPVRPIDPPQSRASDPLSASPGELEDWESFDKVFGSQFTEEIDPGSDSLFLHFMGERLVTILWRNVVDSGEFSENWAAMARKSEEGQGGDVWKLKFISQLSTQPLASRVYRSEVTDVILNWHGVRFDQKWNDDTDPPHEIKPVMEHSFVGQRGFSIGENDVYEVDERSVKSALDGTGDFKYLEERLETPATSDYLLKELRIVRLSEDFAIVCFVNLQDRKDKPQTLRLKSTMILNQVEGSWKIRMTSQEIPVKENRGSG